MQTLKQFRDHLEIEKELEKLRVETIQKIESAKNKPVKTVKDKVDRKLELEYLERYLQVVESDLKRAKLETNIQVDKVKRTLDVMYQTDFCKLQVEQQAEIREKVKEYNSMIDDRMAKMKKEVIEKFGISQEEITRCRQYDIGFSTCFYNLEKLEINGVGRKWEQ